MAALVLSPFLPPHLSFLLPSAQRFHVSSPSLHVLCFGPACFRRTIKVQGDLVYLPTHNTSVFIFQKPMPWARLDPGEGQPHTSQWGPALLHCLCWCPWQAEGSPPAPLYGLLMNNGEAFFILGALSPPHTLQLPALIYLIQDGIIFHLNVNAFAN